MWTATITNKTFNTGICFVGVTYTNGTDSFDINYPVSSQDEISRLGDIIEAKLKDLENVSSFLGDTSGKVRSTKGNDILIELKPVDIKSADIKIQPVG